MTEAHAQLRLGKISASNIYKLLGKDDSKFTEAGLTYLRELLAQQMTLEVPQGYETEAIRWGNTYEPEAIEFFKRQYKPEKLVYFGGENPQWFVHPVHSKIAGASPDSDIRLSGIDYVGEIKCPFNSAVHIRNLELETPADVAKEHPDYYAQMQMQMICLDYENALFISYDPRNVKYPMRVIHIPLDNEMVAKINAKLDLAKLTIADIRTRINTNLQNELKTEPHQ